jgi:hypothetical protein
MAWAAAQMAEIQAAVRAPVLPQLASWPQASLRPVSRVPALRLLVS